MKIGFLAMPNSALFGYKFISEISLSATQTAGYLESQGHSVDLFDLNARLNRFRSEDNEVIEQKEFEALTSIKGLIGYLNNPADFPNLTLWAENCSQLLDEKKYDGLCLSIDRKLYKRFPSIAALNFSIIFISHFKSKAPYIVGGELALSIIGEDYIRELVPQLPKQIHPKAFVRGHDLSKLPKDLYFNSSEPTEEAIIKFIGSDFPVIEQVKPKLNNLNTNDNKVDPGIIHDLPQDISSRPNKPEDIDLSPFRFSNGCPFRCSFCPSGVQGAKQPLTPSSVADQLECFYDHGKRNFRFYNNNINFNKNFLIDLCNEIIKRKLRIQFSDSANLKIADEEIFNALREAGCIKLWFGTETVSERLLKENRKQTPISRVIETLELSSKNNIWNACNFIVNFPHETEEESNLLYNFVAKYTGEGLIHTFQVNNFKVLPATEYHSNPEKFRISVNKKIHRDGYYQFDEIEGLNWDAKLLQGVKRKNRYDKIYSEDEVNIRSSDAFYFLLRQTGIGNQEISNICSELGSILRFDQKSNVKDWFRKTHPWIPHLKDYEEYLTDGDIFTNSFSNTGTS